MPKFLGVKNLLEKEAVLTHDGVHTVFKPGEIRILEEPDALHANTRTITFHQKDGDTKSPILAKKMFSIFSATEALKLGAKIEDGQDPMGDAKVALDMEKEIENRLLSKLQADGWKAPEKNGKK